MCAGRGVSAAGNKSPLQVSYDQFSVGCIFPVHIGGGGALRPEVVVSFSFFQLKQKLLRFLGQSPEVGLHH